MNFANMEKEKIVTQLKKMSYEEIADMLTVRDAAINSEHRRTAKLKSDLEDEIY